MQITRNNINKLNDLISSLSDKQFDISTQYKFLVLSKEISKEKQIYDEQLYSLIDKYAEKDSNGTIIRQDGGIKIHQESIAECTEQIKQLDNFLISLPDLYFTIDELAPLELTLGQLQLLEPFIKI